MKVDLTLPQIEVLLTLIDSAEAGEEIDGIDGAEEARFRAIMARAEKALIAASREGRGRAIAKAMQP